MTYRITKLTVALCAALTMALSLGGCKEDTIISSNVTPAIDNISTFQVTLPDSFYTAKTVRDDSIITSSLSTSIYQALGRVDNDGIAATTASIYLQFVPKSTATAFPSGEVLDSAFVILPYAGFTWGDTTIRSDFRINAYRITDTLSIGTQYFPFTKKATAMELAGTGTFSVGKGGTDVIRDSVLLGSTRVAPHLRVKLNASTIDALRSANDTNTTFAGFVNGFRGLYLVPDSLSGSSRRALPYFLVDGTVSNYSSANLLVYSHNAARTNGDTTISFPYNPTYNARYNRISRVYDQSIFSTNNQWLYMQNQPGAAIDFQFKNLDKQTIIPAGTVINQVELTFTKKRQADDAAYFGPARIYPQGVTANGVRYTILDRYPTTSQDGLNFIDGTPRTTSGDTIRYVLNIPRELQLAITTKQSGLHLLIGGTVNFPAAYRLIVGSPTNPTLANRPVIKIIYSKQQ